MKYVILVPVYNDRESLKLLVENINQEIKDLNSEISNPVDQLSGPI